MKHLLALALPWVLAFSGAGLQAPTPKTAPTAPALEGSVRGPDGKAVPEALVIARSMQELSAPPLTTHSDAKGSFRLILKDGGVHTVRVEARGLAGVTLEKVRPGSPLAVTLAKGATLQGSVRDASTNQPVARARVEARDSKAILLTWEPDAGSASALTDEQGRYRIEGLGSWLHTVSVSVRGYGAARKSDVKPGSTGVDLYLFPGASISGVVRGPDGKPVAAAVVRADPEVIRGAVPRPALTLADGRYEVAGLEPGAYRLVVRHRDFAPSVGTRVALDRDSELLEDVVLEKGGRVIGRLTDAEGRPVPGRVSVTELGGQPMPRVLADLRTEAGADGRFRLGAFPEGDHALSVVATGYAAKRVDARVARDEPETDVGDVALEPGLAIRGRVKERGGAVVAGASLTAFPSRPTLGAFLMPIEGRSESDGSFALGGLVPGSYRVSIRAPGYGQVDRTLDAGDKAAEIVMTPAGGITGQAVDDEGKAIEVFRVSSRSVATGTPGGGSGPSRTQDVSSADGRFALEDVAEGTHVLSVSAPERVPANVSGVKVTAGSATEVGRVRLSAGGIVRGSVVEPTGAPIAGASVTARGAGRDFFLSFGPQAVSDGAGSFEIRGAPVGLVEVAATHPSYAEGRVPGIEVDPAKGPAEARIVLGQGGRIEGFVRRRDGRGVPGVSVNVAPIRREGGFTFSSQSMLPTRDDGYYVAEHVPSGRARVFLMSGAGGGMMSNSQDKEVEVRDGGVVNVDFVSQEILVSGRITRSGAPGSGLRVNLRSQQNTVVMMSMGSGAPAAGPQRNTATTRDDGSYEMLASASGKSVVSVERLDGKGSLPSREVTIPDADSYALDLDFSGVSVAGTVLDADTEEPLARANVFASPKSPASATGAGSGMVTAVSGPDGRFTLELDPIEYRVSARMSESDYGPGSVEVDGASGAEIRLALKRGGAIAGRVLDSGGRAVASAFVSAVAGEGPQISSGGNITLPDGSFRIGGLRQEPHSVLARSDLGAFAVRTGVAPGEKEVVLTLRPAGRLRVQVLGPDQKPVEGVRVFVSRYRGGPIAGIASNATDAQGMIELLVPAGTLELKARKDKLEATASASVNEGGETPLQMVLLPAKE